MYWGSGALSLLIGVIGGVLLVCSVLLGRRLGRRRAIGAAGAGLMLLGLSLSGLIDVISRALAIFSFNPLRWLGVGAAVLGFLMLSWSGFLPRRKASEPKAAKAERRGEVEPKRAASAPVDDDMAEIEEILRRRGIS